MARLFTSDLHLGHQTILNSRPQFTTVEEMDEELIQLWNQKVARQDDVYILGDLSFRSPHPIGYYLDRMKGRKHLIIGNHDCYWMRKVENMSQYFETVESLATIKFNKKKVTLCHYPMLEWSGSRYAENLSSYLIHGHIHAAKNSVFDYIKDNLPTALNCCADVNGLVPVTFEELIINNAIWYDRLLS